MQIFSSKDEKRIYFCVTLNTEQTMNTAIFSFYTKALPIIRETNSFTLFN